MNSITQSKIMLVVSTTIAGILVFWVLMLRDELRSSKEKIEISRLETDSLKADLFIKTIDYQELSESYLSTLNDQDSLINYNTKISSAKEQTTITIRECLKSNRVLIYFSVYDCWSCLRELVEIAERYKDLRKSYIIYTPENSEAYTPLLSYLNMTYPIYITTKSLFYAKSKDRSPCVISIKRNNLAFVFYPVKHDVELISKFFKNLKQQTT